MSLSRINLGITGSIAAYKIPELIRLLTAAGTSVTPILTNNATQFVTPLTVATVAQQPPLQNPFEISGSIAHLSDVRSAELFVVAPATANSIAKFANGIADDLLSAAFLSFEGPKLIVPAMHTEMYRNPITQRNIKTLRSYGVYVLGPDEGDLACGDTGKGRMVAPEVIFKWISSFGLGPLKLNGKRILITCGGTQEDIDNVRVLANRSTGKLGISLAEMASFYGASVSVVSSVPIANSSLLSDVSYVKSVSQLSEATRQAFDQCDFLYMAAAVSDFTVQKKEGKIRRQQSKASLELIPTEDVLAGLCQRKKDQKVVGFCLVDDHLEAEAHRKLTQKGADYVVGNSSKALGADTRDFVIVSKTAPDAPQAFQGLSVSQTAHQLLQLAVSK